MVFGYMVTRRLLPVVKCFGRLPPSVGSAFAGLLDAGTKPFDWVNYWGSWAASRVRSEERRVGKGCRARWSTKQRKTEKNGSRRRQSSRDARQKRTTGQLNRTRVAICTDA